MKKVLSLFFLCFSLQLLSDEIDTLSNSMGHSALKASSIKSYGGFVYISAQAPIDPITGEMVEGDIHALTDLVIDHLQQQLKLRGYKLKQVVKTEVYLKDIRDFEGMNAAYGARFNFQHPPARDVIEVPNLLNNARIEISCIARKGNS